MREMYIKYDVVAGYRLASISMGNGKISALNYRAISDNSKMVMTVKEFEKYQAMNNKTSKMRELYEQYDVMLGYKLVGIQMGNGRISALRFVSVTDDKSDRMILTGDDLLAYEHYVRDLVAVGC